MKTNMSNYVKQISKKKNKKNTKKTRAELNEEARKQKKLKNRKGLPAGHRHQEGLAKEKNKAVQIKSDPRLGSKIKIDLTKYSTYEHNVESPLNSELSSSVLEDNSHLDNKSRQALEQELFKLESSTRLDKLMMQLDEGAELSETDAQYVEETLNRISELYDILNIEDVEDLDELDDLDESSKGDDLMRLLKS